MVFDPSTDIAVRDTKGDGQRENELVPATTRRLPRRRVPSAARERGKFWNRNAGETSQRAGDYFGWGQRLRSACKAWSASHEPWNPAKPDAHAADPSRNLQKLEQRVRGANRDVLRYISAQREIISERHACARARVTCRRISEILEHTISRRRVIYPLINANSYEPIIAADYNVGYNSRDAARFSARNSSRCEIFARSEYFQNY